MSASVNLGAIATDVALIKSEITYIKRDLNEKHQENRVDIVEIKKDVLAIKLLIAKATGWAIAAASGLTIALHYIDKAWK